MSDSADDHTWYHQQSSCDNDVVSAPDGWPDYAMPNDNTFGGHRGRAWDDRGIHSLIRAVSEHCRNLELLEIHSCLSYAPMTIFQMSENVLGDACTVARRLTRLNVRVRAWECDYLDDIQQQNRFFERFLLEAKELRCLNVSGYVDIECLMDKFWPNLEKLGLEDLGMDPSETREIIQTHRNTLCELKLGDPKWRGEPVEWDDVAKELAQYLRLHHVMVYGLDGFGDKRERFGSLTVARSFM